MEPLRLPGTLDSLSSIGAYVLAAAAEAGLEKKAAYRLRLAVDEIATNSIVHGYEEAGIEGMLEVQADIDEHDLTIFLEDTAGAYDPRQTMLPQDLDQPLEERQIGGLGVYLTVQGVDTFLYERVGDRNRNIFVMNRPANATAAVRDQATTTRARLLVVDASELNRNMLSRQLEVLGFSVTLAQNSQQALDLVNSKACDLILLDTDLPEMSASQVLEHIRADEKKRHLPVIMLSRSTNDSIERVGKYLEMGADDYLTQPFSALMLNIRIHACLELRRLRDEEQTYSRNEQLLKLERDVQIGRQIQADFLPETLPQLPGWEIAARFEPAREVAGDFYDAFMMTQGRRVGFVIADVCDKGVGAALFMALFRSLIRALAQQNYPERDLFESLSGDQPAASAGQRRTRPGIGAAALREALLRTNNYIIDNHLQTNMFATLFFGVLDPTTGALIYINGGHNPPAILGPTGVKARLQPTGPAVGIMPDGPFTVQQTQLEPGEILFLFTDGATDAKDPNGQLFTEKRLLSLVAQPVSSATAMLGGVEASLRGHIGSADQFDDITMLAVRRLPSEPV